MLGINEMLADMLKKAIPPEVAALLTEEKVKEFGEKANAFISDIRQSLDFIKEQNATTHDMLEGLASQIKLLEETKNVNRSDGGSSTRKPRAKSSDSNGGSPGD